MVKIILVSAGWSAVCFGVARVDNVSLCECPEMATKASIDPRAKVSGSAPQATEQQKEAIDSTAGALLRFIEDKAINVNDLMVQYDDYICF